MDKHPIMDAHEHIDFWVKFAVKILNNILKSLLLEEKIPQHTKQAREGVAHCVGES